MLIWYTIADADWITALLLLLVTVDMYIPDTFKLAIKWMMVPQPSSYSFVVFNLLSNSKCCPAIHEIARSTLFGLLDPTQ
jgi:hypothetical protein